MNYADNFEFSLEENHSTPDHEQLKQACKNFCAQHGFEHYLLHGSIFTHLQSPISYTVTSPGKAARHKNQKLSTIIEESIDSSTPVVTGNIDETESIYHSISNIIRRPSSKQLSITFPVHFPLGKFALFHVSTYLNKQDIHDKVVNTLVEGNQFARQAGTSVIQLLESDLDNSSSHLNERERECLLLACDGISPPDISKQLGLSSHTVIYYLKTARQKLQSKNTQGAISKALLSGDVRNRIGSEKAD